MDLVAALATIEDEPRRVGPLALVVAALVVLAVATPSDGLSVLAMLAALATGSVVVRRQQEREARRAARVGDAVAAFLQVEHGLSVWAPLEVHLRGARGEAVDHDGVSCTVDVRWTAVGGRAGHAPSAIAGPVELRLRSLTTV
jgi:hypothetical protein